MKAIRFHGINDLRLAEIPRPKPEGNEVLLKTAAVGICGSDVHYFMEGGTGNIKLDHPLILGHEFSARFAEGPQTGNLVAVDPAIPCGKCEFCLEGNPNFCIDLTFAGAETTDGALREWIAWPDTGLHLVPKSISPQEAALLEPLGVAIHAMRLGKVQPGMSVGVLGCGPIGLLTIQMARAAGATRIFATEKIPQRLAYASSCGATDLLLAEGEEHKTIQEETKGRGLDVVFEAAGDDGSAVDTAIKSSKRGGTLVLIGIPSEDKTVFTASAARRRGLTIKLDRRMKNTYPTAIDLVRKNVVDVSSLITHQYPMKDFREAFKVAASREGVKVVLNFE